MTVAHRFAAAQALVLALAVAATGEEYVAPTVYPTVGSSPARLSGRKPRSLAEVARDVRLAQPGGGAVVVTDANLKQLATGGRISVANGTGQLEERRPAAVALLPPADPRAAWEKQYKEQLAAVKRASDWSGRLEQRRASSQDPYSSDLGAYSRAPGATSVGEQQREDAGRALDRQRDALRRLEEQGRRLGIVPRDVPR